MELSQLTDRTDPIDRTDQTLETPSLTNSESWSLAQLQISKARQKGDCLYLHTITHNPVEIIKAIATGTSSSMMAEGIKRLKLHGKNWGLGVDMPIGESAIMAAMIIQQLKQDHHIGKVLLKVLLKQNCLNILCESPQAISQAEMALPILNVLRKSRPSDYLQSVTVSGRIRGENSLLWSFDIDLLSIGIMPAEPEPALSQDAHVQAEPEPDAELEEEQHAPSQFWQSTYLVIQDFFQLQWLIHRGQTSAKVNGGLCTLALILGLGASFMLDRTLARYVQQLPEQGSTALSAVPSQSVKLTSDRQIPDFNNAHISQKLALLEWHMSVQRRAPEVLIMGSSRALRGVDPTVLEQSLQAQGYKDIQVFNMGINGATAKVVNLQLTQILADRQLPRMVIWADGVRAFNSSRNDLTYNEIASSSGYQQIQSPSNQQTAEAPEKNASDRSNSQSAQAFPTPKLDGYLNLMLSAYPKREQLRTSFRKTYNQLTAKFNNSDAIVAASLPNRLLEIDTKGFISLNIEFNPATYFKTYPSVPGEYDLDYRGFDINGEQMDAFNALSNFCRQHNIYLVFVNMPLHGSYLDAARSRYEATFTQRMQELANRWRFTYIDLSRAWTTKAEYFSDPSHLNRKGAIAVAQELIRNPNVAWRSAISY